MNKKLDKETLELLGLSEQEFMNLEKKLFEDMENKQPLFVIPYLIEKYHGCDNPLGDLAKDCVEDSAISPHIPDGLKPVRFFNYVASVCCDACFTNALEPFIKKYNEIAPTTHRVCKIRGERSYEFVWFRQYMNSTPLEKYFSWLIWYK